MPSTARQPVRWSAALSALLLAACGGGDADDSRSASPSATASGAAAVQETEFPERVYWGDTHLHTGNSFDVYLFGTPTSTPETAYRFAKGESVESPTTGQQWQLQRPLDFLVVADHAEALGSVARMFAGDPEIADTDAGRAFLEIAPDETEEQLQEVYDEIVLLGSGMEDQATTGISTEQLVVDMHGGEKRRGAWERHVEAAERHNDPGTFTTFIGWEWSAQPSGGNLHRVVFMPQGGDVAAQFLPYSSFESQDPRDLWAWLETTSARTGAEFIAIPHNPNISIGLFFPTETLTGEPIDAAYAEARMRWEPAVEGTQNKGDSEAHPLLSPTDEFADFETYPFVLTPDGRTPDPTEGDYARSGLKRGLALEAEIGVNPFKFGMIGSTDSHTGMSAVEETNFAGKGQHDATPEQRPHPTGLGSSRGWDMGAAGYAGVWATANTREALADAFRRKEIYASTGPRITVRLFGGFDFSEADADAENLADAGYARGVPMGGDLGPGEGAPGFLVAAMKDPDEANLDRIQIIKGWLNADGSTEERIYDVALSDGRTDGSEAVGSTVDLTTGEYTNDIGATELVAYWEDPDFDPEQSAFYYARVLQIPTPRYSLLDAIELGIDVEETGRPATIQERAYTSPIWYSPGG
ncbi:MAG: DUF3604 domain-containing protein [Gemmatimonadota bacterium]